MKRAIGFGVAYARLTLLRSLQQCAALEKPDTFKRSRAVGAWLGLTPRRFQSGEVDYDGHISRRGDRQLRALLYEAAAVLLTRVRRESALRRWGLMLWKRLGFKRADRKSTRLNSSHEFVSRMPSSA